MLQWFQNILCENFHCTLLIYSPRSTSQSAMTTISHIRTVLNESITRQCINFSSVGRIPAWCLSLVWIIIYPENPLIPKLALSQLDFNNKWKWTLQFHLKRKTTRITSFFLTIKKRHNKKMVWRDHLQIHNHY